MTIHLGTLVDWPAQPVPAPSCAFFVVCSAIACHIWTLRQGPPGGNGGLAPVAPFGTERTSHVPVPLVPRPDRCAPAAAGTLHGTALPAAGGAAGTAAGAGGHGHRRLRGAARARD